MPSNKPHAWRLGPLCAVPVLLTLAAGCTAPAPAVAPVTSSVTSTSLPEAEPRPESKPAILVDTSPKVDVVVAPKVEAAAPAPMAAPVPVAAAPVRPLSAMPRIRSTPDLLAQQMFDGALQALKAGKVAEAEQTLNVIARTHPELGGAMANLGLIHRQAGRLPQALEAFDKAIAANPEQPVFHAQKALTLREMGRFPEAKTAYETALQLNPNYALAALNLGVLLDLYMGDSAGAMVQFQRYLALTPAGDPVVTKWVAELKNRKPEAPTSKEPS